MDGLERVRKQLRVIGPASIALGAVVLVGSYLNDDMHQAVGGTVRGLLIAGAFIGAGITAIWRGYKTT